MKICVTGVAGFIGSRIAAKMLDNGTEVIGIDCFTDYYDRRIKELNLSAIKDKTGFQFFEQDVIEFDFQKHLAAGDVIFHEAAQPGVRASWGREFEIYTANNVLATQRMLEKVKDIDLKKIILAGSSSVYGDVDTFPMNEDDHPRPVSPYGVTKLASEHLCMLYYRNFQVPTVSLRYFTVYGPGQRPDMAFHRFSVALATEKLLPLYGTGSQTRDFTFIDDIVNGNIAAIEADCAGQVINLGGGSRISLMECIHILEDISGKKAKFDQGAVQKGDVRHTAADITKAEELLGYEPKVSVARGLEAEYAWIMKLMEQGYAG